MPEHSLPQPDFDCALLIRTDYSDDRAWQLMIDAVQTPSEDDFLAGVTIVNDPVWEGADTARLADALPEGYRHPLIIVADGYAQTGPGFPLLVAHLRHRPASSIRVAADSLWSIENNLNLANVDWKDYADHLGPDGIYREPA